MMSKAARRREERRTKGWFLQLHWSLAFIPSRVPASGEGCRVYFGQMSEVPGYGHSHGLVDLTGEKEAPEKQSKPSRRPPTRLLVDQMDTLWP